MSTIQIFISRAPSESPSLASEALRTTSSARAGVFRFASSPGESDSAQVEISPSSRLQSGRTAVIELGSHAREVDATLKRAAELAEAMHKQLVSITKQFPPFAADDDERFRFLNGFSGLRAQFESLTFPPEPEAKGEWALLHYPAEQPNWDVPALDPATATDEDLRMAESMLERIGGDIQQRRQSLHDSVISVVGGESQIDEARILSQALKDRLAA